GAISTLTHVVGGNNYLNLLELFQLQIAGRCHSVLEGAHQVGGAVSHCCGAVQDFLQRTHLTHLHAVTARQFGVVRFRSPVPTVTRGLGGPCEGGAEHHGVSTAGNSL